MIGRGGDLGALGRWPVWVAGLAIVVALVGLNHAPLALRALHREVTVYRFVYTWCRAQAPRVDTILEWLDASVGCANVAMQVKGQLTPREKELMSRPRRGGQAP